MVCTASRRRPGPLTRPRLLLPLKPARRRAPSTTSAPTCRTASGELRKVLADPYEIFDEAKRKEAAPKAIPAMKKMVALFDEAAAKSTDADEKEELTNTRTEFNTLLSLMGDADARATLSQWAQSKDKAEATRGQGAQLLARYWQSIMDADAQGKVIDDVRKLAQANPMSDEVTRSVLAMARFGSASQPNQDRLLKIVTEDLKSEIAKGAAEQLMAAEKLKGLTGKPLALAGKTVDGKQFTTADWKGKVILVDFWATWCGPCRAELPQVKKAYADYHAKGLEVLGVSCDRDEKALKTSWRRTRTCPGRSCSTPPPPAGTRWPRSTASRASRPCS